ncbi:cilia- and flagella-associated protein 251-like [Solea solea]|uniref:cilia- and flagella-associated protein 251-like n=1 Tax=Solea solea TaxID=90069 RepID=UPI00272A93F0|nr:cilia- and flagella-associated protein 251-like [Solea solea]
MDGLRLPPLIEEALDSTDDPCDLKAEISPNMDNEMTAKERGVLEENNEKEEMDQERAQEEEEEGEERKLKEEEEEGEGEDKSRKEQEPLTEEQELEELRAQVLQLLLELEDARETSNKHEESFSELQGGATDSNNRPFYSFLIISRLIPKTTLLLEPFINLSVFLLLYFYKLFWKG